uniref:Uncharacterized protein n=1 Tax=Sorghum bicolor TaxID=4558 RepID=Q9XE76_SORBI|nr:hypothetical protein [Sorghum bicolor]
MKLHLDDAKLEKNPLDPCRSKGEKIILTRRQEIALLRSGDLRVVSLATYDSAAAPDSPPDPGVVPTRLFPEKVADEKARRCGRTTSFIIHSYKIIYVKFRFDCKLWHILDLTDGHRVRPCMHDDDNRSVWHGLVDVDVFHVYEPDRVIINKDDRRACGDGVSIVCIG